MSVIPTGCIICALERMLTSGRIKIEKVVKVFLSDTQREVLSGGSGFPIKMALSTWHYSNRLKQCKRMGSMCGHSVDATCGSRLLIPAFLTEPRPRDHACV